MDWAQETCFSSGFILKLEDGQDNDGKIFRVKKGQKVHFLLGASLAFKEVTVFTDSPAEGQASQRDEFRALSWNNPGKVGDKSSVLATILFTAAGSFRYYFSYPGNDKAGCGYFLVEPTLLIGNNDEVLPLDAVSMQTVLSKNLSNLSSWEQRLRVGKETGYNATHFTPIQQLGGSNSAYSISDQLSLNPTFSKGEASPCTLEGIGAWVEKMRKDWKMVSTVDVVWNHTSKDSEWLKNHQFCTYNLQNTPHFRPAYVLDRALFYFSVKLFKGDLARFPSGMIKDEKDLSAIKELLMRTIIPPLQLWEFFQCDIDKELHMFKTLCENFTLPPENPEGGHIKIEQDPEWKRFGCSIDMDKAINQFYFQFDRDLTKGLDAFNKTLQWLNDSQREIVEADMAAAVDSIINTVRYDRLDPNGPRLGKVTKLHPIVPRYFHHTYPDTLVETDEAQIMNDPTKAVNIMAHNGWVMNHNALENFAHFPHMVYFKRQLICWGDSVKLRYGDKPEDCPYLWSKMKEYTEQMARTFHGLRIDNCHSTPIHVAEYMLKAARVVRPELYVFAELFTGDEHTDNLFVNRLGLNSLVRECLNAWNSHEEGRLIYLYGGEPIASFNKGTIPLMRASRAHALFYDVTHDNECMMGKRSIYDVLPSSALVAMSCCAVGSSRGHDELVPHHVNVVTEDRPYRPWSDSDQATSDQASASSGMIRFKRCLNDWHHRMALDGYSQVFVDQRSEDVVAVTRHNPDNHNSYVMIAHTAFDDDRTSGAYQGEPLRVEGKINQVHFEARPTAPGKNTRTFVDKYNRNERLLNGVDAFPVEFSQALPVDESKCIRVEYDSDNRVSVVELSDFPQGSVVMFDVEHTDDIKSFIKRLCQIESDFDKIVDRMTLNTLNYVLFCCEEEQMTFNKSYPTFEVPEWRNLVYCGLMGIALPMQEIKRHNDLGHPICTNLRQGDWLCRYMSSRLERYEDTATFGDWLDCKFRLLAKIPRFLIPTYFERLLGMIINRLLNVCWRKMSPFVRDGGPCVRALSLASVALMADVKGAKLPLVPEDKVKVGKQDKWPSMSAGLPHFSEGYMRCWGRDTFIAMRGLLMLTGRMREARQIILAFAGCLRHGLIPNLLSEGRNPRYNCRDAVWFWLQSIQDYCVREGNYDILTADVFKAFPNDSSPPQLTVTTAKKVPLCEVMQQALNAHANDILFTERDAGEKLDRNMTEKGFEVRVVVDWTTGFIHGGSEHNCGTWCDKMGESERAGNKGVPATPRDGCAIEIIALAKSTTRWLHQVRKEGHFPYEGVKYRNHLNKSAKKTWKEWGDRIKKAFRAAFYVSEEHDSEHVHKRGIYKDTHSSSKPWCDYQLRPNFAVAMTFAPELFKTEEAWGALEIAQDKLLGPMGIKTLDPDDMQYRGDYDNSIDNDDSSVAKGFNYHQGPEWLWPAGYFLRAKLHFSKGNEQRRKETIEFIQSYLVRVQQQLDTSDWLGLPELTNSDGKLCKDSCPIQAWSHSSFLELMYDLAQVGDDQQQQQA